MLRGHCAGTARALRGHRPRLQQITCSCLLRYDGDLDALLTTLATWRDAGADLAVIGLPLHAKPEILADLASDVAQLS